MDLTTLRNANTCLLLLLVPLVLNGCPEKAKGRIGDPCSSDGECESGTCIEGVCLSPYGDYDGDGLVNIREAELGTNATRIDSDGDGKDDLEETYGNLPDPVDENGDGIIDADERDEMRRMDKDRDGLIDAIESSLASADGDKDCLPDEIDAQNDVFNEDNDQLALRWCVKSGGVCADEIAQVVALCDTDLAGNRGAVQCDYDAVATYEEFESSCDLLDNDCDGNVDNRRAAANEENPGKTVTPLGDPEDDGTLCVRRGVCADYEGTVRATCKSGRWDCEFSDLPGFEPGRETTCDGLDNDCDGETDEDFSVRERGVDIAFGDPCRGIGNCAAHEGMVVCDPDDEAAAVCSTAVDFAESERCDLLDNDCDGKTDEDFAVDGYGVGGPCRGVGECADSTGFVECVSFDEAVCSVNLGGSGWAGGDEICDGLDNDCDGRTDVEPVLGAGQTSPCPTAGVCAGVALVVCDGIDPVCDFGAIDGLEDGNEKTCDGLDNDCDGAVDETLPMDFAGAAGLVAAMVPADRVGHAAAVAPEVGRLVLVGGVAPSWQPDSTEVSTRDDTWELDLATGAWTRFAFLPGEEKPPARVGAQLLWDAVGNRMLLVGGAMPRLEGLGDPRDDLWAYDLATHTWSELASSGMPGRAKATAVLASRPGGQREIWLAGGVADRSPEPGVALFRIDLAGPSMEAFDTVAVPPVEGAAGAYDPAGDRIVLFGGEAPPADTSPIPWGTAHVVTLGGAEPVAEVVTLDGDSQAPPMQQGAQMLWDAAQSRFVMVGQGSFLTDPTAWFTGVFFFTPPAGGAGPWSVGSMPDAGGKKPPLESGAVAALDDGRVQLWLGVDPEGLFWHDSWSVNPSSGAWRDEELPQLAPSPRRLAASALDFEGGRWLVYGGATHLATGYATRDDLWIYDLVTERWERKETQASEPPPRPSAPTALYVPGRDELVVSGGLDMNGESGIDWRAPVNEMWRLNVNTGIWSKSLMTADGGPGPLAGHSAVLTPEGDAILFFGGYGEACASAGEDEPCATKQLWRYELADGSWTELVPDGDAPQARAAHAAFVDIESRRMFVVGGWESDGGAAVYHLDANLWDELPGDPGPATDADVLVALSAHDPWSREAFVATVDMDSYQMRWLRLDLSQLASPVVSNYGGAGIALSALLGAATFDPVRRGALVLGGVDVLDTNVVESAGRFSGGLWRLPQVCR